MSSQMFVYYTGGADGQRPLTVLKMSNQWRIWRFVLPIAVLALLLATTAGVVWHHHTCVVSDNCPICHLSHQTVVPTAANVGVHRPVRTGVGPEPQAVHLVRDAVPRDVPARGPPV